MSESNASRWKAIMKEEVKFLLKNQIWNLEDLLSNALVLTDRWIFKIKKKYDKTLRYKAR